MDIKMTVGGQKLEYDPQETLFFDPEHVFDVIGKQSGNLAWWYSLLAMKEQELADAQVAFDKQAAERDEEIRNQGNKLTETAIKSLLAKEPALVKAQLHLNSLRRDAAFLKAMARGFDSRSALLATAGSAQRAEVEARLRELTGRAKKNHLED
jgi:hypothetical protein